MQTTGTGKLEEKEEGYYLEYDNMTSELLEPDGNVIVPQENFVDWEKFHFYDMNSGKRFFKKIKIQLGLKCNYSCDYCSQRFVPRNKDDHLDQSDMYHIGDEEVSAFVEKFDKLSYHKEEDGTQPIRFELWGGEPFLYWKTMKPLVEQLHKKFPDAIFSVITNGSLFTDEIIDFIVEHKINISVSHDGPGQHVRGPDPFDDPEKKAMIIKLRNKLAVGEVHKISFNAMVHKKNESRADIQKWFLNKVGKIAVGEGGVVDAYDEGGKNNSWQTNEEHIAYRRKAFGEIVNLKTQNFMIQNQKIDGFIDSLKSQRPATALNQKCGMDEPGTMAVDLNGNVTTCQNVTATSFNNGGISHKIGTINEGQEGLENVNINTGTHWSNRKECSECPVLQLCQGSCLFLAPDTDLWDISCNNAFSDNVVWLASALYQITGGKVLYKITGPEGFRKERENIFGFDD